MQKKRSADEAFEGETIRTQVRKATEKIVMGGTAGIISKTSCSPLERVKILSQTGFSKSGAFTLGKDVFIKEGIFGFWRGNLVNCIRVFPNKGILFATNDIYKKLLVKKLDMDKSSKMCGFLSGSLAGMTAVTFTYPLDVIRTRKAGILGGTNPLYGSIRGVSKQIYAKFGIKGFFHGISVTILGAIPYEGLKFGIYPIIKAYLPEADSPQQDTKYKLFAGALTGTTAAVFTYHFDTVRRVRQVSGASNMSQYEVGYLDLYKLLYREGGFPRFYKGIVVNIVRIIPNTALQFTVYETLKEFMEYR